MPAVLTPHSRNIALVVAAALFAQFLDGVIIVTALPQMARDFHVATLDMSIGVTIYMLAVTICIPASAWLADRFGAKRVFLTSIAAFTLASVACGLAQTPGQFALARALQGAGGAVLFPVGRILVLRSAQKSEIVAAIGLTIWPALFAPVLGPALGGFLTEYASWHWNFWINIPLGLINLALVARIVPADRDFRRRPFDGVGFLLTGVTLASLLYGFDGLVQGTLPVTTGVALLILALLAGIAAVYWLLRREHPLIDLRTLRIPTFAATDARAGVLIRMGVNAAPFLLPLMFQVGFGLDAFRAGGLVVAYFIGNLVMKTVTTPTLRRFGFRSVLVVNGCLAGLSTAACGLLGWCQFGSPQELPRIKNRKEYEAGLVTLPDWRLTCFFVDRHHRRQGVAAAALMGALSEISRLGGGIVEAYPEDTHGTRISPTFLHAGSLAMFEAAGFGRQRMIGKNKWVVLTTVPAG